VAEDELSQACLTQYLKCRQLIAQGINPDDVFGNGLLDVTPLIDRGAMKDVHPFTQWVISYVEAFGKDKSLHWTFQLGAVYCLFHLLRVCPIFSISKQLISR
jgi:hypothetical protein